MTLQEVCNKYNVSESSLKSNFPRVQQSILKKHGIKIVKEGRGAKAIYKESIEDDNRAMTLYEETREEMLMDRESLKLMDWDFLVFLAIITTPMLVFRGSYDDFLKYVEISNTENNKRMLKDALIKLKEKDLIIYDIDKTDNEYFIAALYRKVEEEMSIGIGMVRVCKELAKEYNKRSWIPLLKTWLGVQMLSEHQPYTVERLSAMTGLSKYQIIESNKILTKSSIYLTSKAYACYRRCVGVNVILNGFYQQNNRK